MAARLNNTVRRKIAAWLCGGALLFCLAAAARGQEPQHAIEYARYRQAIEAGDGVAAERHAYAAWRAAETELGAAPLTATLAFAYGRDVALADPALALPPLQRAKALADAGLGGAAPGLLNLYLSFAEFALSEPRRRDPEKLRNALLAAEQGPGRRIADEIAMWLELAKVELDNENYEAAAQAAGKAESALIIFAPEDKARLAQAFLARGIASIMPKRRTLEDAITAHEYFENGLRQFPPQKSYASFDPTLAKLAGWKAAANAVILTMDGKDASTSKASRANDTPLFETVPGQPLDCLVKWAERTAPKYPAGAIKNSHIGAVIVVFDLADDTAVHNPRILAEVPSETFSEAVLKAMQSWRLAAPALKLPGCRTNNTAQFTFVIDE